MPQHGLPKNVQELILLVNDFRASTIEAHDAIFRFRVKNLFKPMDFKSLHSRLEANTNAIEELEVNLHQQADQWAAKLNEQDLTLLLLYLSHLKKVSAKLCDIAGNLQLKSKGQPYATQQYKADVDEYEHLTDAYAQLGGDVDNLFRKFS